jgi:RNA polymerase sigma factor (sigma-70 family)
MTIPLNQSKNVTGTKNTSKPDLDALVNQHWNRICWVVYRLVGDWDEVQDIALETFLQLHQNPPKHEENLEGWLYRVASNRGLNVLRSRGRRIHYEDQTVLSNNLEAGSDDPAEILERAQERDQVRAVLSLIHPRSAQLLALRYSGMTYADLAVVLQVSKNSIGTLLARAEDEFEKVYIELASGWKEEQ